MSYRNDHDAALARVDALTHELDRTEAERDHLRAEVDQLRKLSPRATMSRSKLAISILAATLGMCAALLSHHHGPSGGRSYSPAPEPEPPPLKVLPPPAIAPEPPARASQRSVDATTQRSRSVNNACSPSPDQHHPRAPPSPIKHYQEQVRDRLFPDLELRPTQKLAASGQR